MMRFDIKLWIWKKKRSRTIFISLRGQTSPKGQNAHVPSAQVIGRLLAGL